MPHEVADVVAILLRDPRFFRGPGHLASKPALRMATALERVRLADLLLVSSCSKFPYVSALRPRTFRGDRLRELRNAARPKISQGELANRIGAHVTSISDWERGANAPSGRHVASLAREFSVDAEHFYGSDDDAEEPHPMPAHWELMEALHYSLGVALRASQTVKS